MRAENIIWVGTRQNTGKINKITSNPEIKVRIEKDNKAMGIL